MHLPTSLLIRVVDNLWLTERYTEKREQAMFRNKVWRKFSSCPEFFSVQLGNRMLADKEQPTIQRTSFLSRLRFVKTDELKVSICGGFEHVKCGYQE